LPDSPHAGIFAAVSDLDWLLSTSSSDFAVPPGTRFEANDDNWRASVERIPLAQNLDVYLNDIEARRDFRAEPMSPHVGPMLVSQVALEGQLDLDLGDGQRISATPDSALLYRRPDPCAIHCFLADIRFRSIGYSMPLPRAERLLEGYMPSKVRALLDGGQPSSGYFATTNRAVMRRLARTIFSVSLTGALRRLMVEGTVLQLFALQVAETSHVRATDRALGGRERGLALEARDRLLADMRQPPSLGELAAAVGSSEKQLNTWFRKTFGTTVFEALRDHRLEHARRVLEAGDLSLKEIAWRVGYSDVTNFVHAFRAHFGFPPRQYIEQSSR
jgi:AraC-like DNA-binding protein